MLLYAYLLFAAVNLVYRGGELFGPFGMSYKKDLEIFSFFRCYMVYSPVCSKARNLATLKFMDG
uniref:Uncharacterized protein n=1 Tax=Arundo donax TaxID=35708 RepID=A0A0A9DK05_ARUDO